MELGAKVITASDSGGSVIDEAGSITKTLAILIDIKNGRIEEYALWLGLGYVAGEKPWVVAVGIALPCGTQNEVDGDDARELVTNGVKCVAECANMASNLDALEVFLSHKILCGPGKAANAGGVATSGLEMTQNAERLPWERHGVDARLRIIMCEIYNNCVRYG
jgi:glutamate dehydrogenase (NADP+)